MTDKKVMKLYRKIVTSDSSFAAFRLVDRLDPTTAKRVLITMVMNQKKS